MNLDQAIDELFRLPPDGFIAARDELVRTLQGTGDPEAASAVKALRKPTLIAWALNQLPHRERVGLDALIASGDELRKAQGKALSGVEGTGFRTAMEGRRKVVRGLTRRAIQILHEVGRGGQSADEEIARSLEAASTDPQAATALLEGRLTKPIAGVSGFESFSGLSLVEGASGKEAAERAEHKARETELKNAERNAEKAEVDARRARVRADTLAHELEEIGRRVEDASREAERLEAELEEARARLDSFRQRG